MATIQGTGITGVSAYFKNTLIPSITTIRVANIFDYEPTDLGGYPSVTITSQEILGKFLDNSRNERTFRFSIRVFIDRNAQNFGSLNAETILRTVSDEMILKIDADPTLGGNCTYTKVAGIKYGYVNRQSNNIRMAEVVIDCIDIITYR